MGYPQLIAFGLAAVGGYLQRRARKPLAETPNPTPHIVGSQVPYALGTQIVAPVVGRLQDFYQKKEKIPGAKGLFGSPKQKVWYSRDAVQYICVGQVDALNYITRGPGNQDDVQWTGIISPDSHPSGTSVVFDKIGTGTIFWGEPDQPAHEIDGITSRRPHLCYIHWTDLRLGTSKTMPHTEFSIARRTRWWDANMTGTAWTSDTATVTGDTTPVLAVLADADEEVGYIEISNKKHHYAGGGNFVTLNSVGALNGQYLVLRSELETQITVQPDGTSRTHHWRRIYLSGGTVGATATGTLERMQNSHDGGLNPAAALGEAFFGEWPLGLGLDPDGAEPFDLDSLQEVFDVCDTNSWRCAVRSTDGGHYETLIDAILQDFRIFLYIDPGTGKWTFRILNEEPTPLAEMPLAKRIASSTNIGDRATPKKVIFTFYSVARFFTQSGVRVSDTGAIYSDWPRAKVVELRSVPVFRTAAALAELRSPEHLADPLQTAEIEVMGDTARDVIPGDVVPAGGVDWSVLKNTIDPDSESVKLDCIAIPRSPSLFVHPEQTQSPPVDPPLPANTDGWVETPPHYQPGQGAIPLVVGAFDAEVYTATDHEGPFTSVGAIDASISGGRLRADLESVDEEDWGAVQDLSADDAGWRQGLQWAVIISDTLSETEVCFYKGPGTILSAGVRDFLASDLLRARLGTRQISQLTEGDRIFILNPAELDHIDGVRGELYVSVVPPDVFLADVEPWGGIVKGPPAVPDGVIATSRYSQTGDLDVLPLVITGSYVTGAGQVDAGDAIGDPVCPGYVEVEAVGLGLVISGAPATILTIDAATIDGYSRPATLELRARHVSGGYFSDWSPSTIVYRLDI